MGLESSHGSSKIGNCVRAFSRRLFPLQFFSPHLHFYWREIGKPNFCYSGQLLIKTSTWKMTKIWRTILTFEDTREGLSSSMLFNMTNYIDVALSIPTGYSLVRGPWHSEATFSTGTFLKEAKNQNHLSLFIITCILEDWIWNIFC